MPFRRHSIHAPYLVDRIRCEDKKLEKSLNAVFGELNRFLRYLQNSDDAGLPAGGYEGLPTTIQAGLEAAVGEPTDGWSPGTHFHPISTGIPVELGYEADEGASLELARATHVHPYFDLYEDLVAAWRFEEASGDRYPSMGEHILTENGATASATGKIGDAADFTGSENLYVADGTALQQGEFDYSVALWVKLDSIAADQWIVAKDSASNLEYGLYYDSTAGAFVATLGSTTPTTYTVEDEDVTPATGTWYFVRFWYDHAASTINIRVNDGTTYSTSCASETPYTGTDSFMVGAHEYGAETDELDGQVDALHWHQRALSDGEHEILYAGGDGRELWLPQIGVPGGTNLILPAGSTVKNAAGISSPDQAICFVAPWACEVINVKALRRDGTGATVNMRKNFTSNHLSSDLSLAAVDTLYDGGTIQNASYSAGDIMEAMVQTATGSPTHMTILAYVRRTA